MKRWKVEVTFQEVREHLGVETQRQWSDKAIERTTPILFGLFSIICLIFNEFYKTQNITPKQYGWYRKKEITFSDVISEVRRKILFSKYINSDKSDDIGVFMYNEFKYIINQLLDAA